MALWGGFLNRFVDWLPEGMHAAVCFSIDDVHPGKSSDEYEAGGDLADGALGLIEDLLSRHSKLHATLFVTPDWREIAPIATRRILKKIPKVRERLYLTRILPRGTMAIDRHPDFVAYLRGLPRTEIGLHGLHHVHKGPSVIVEYQTESTEEIERNLRQGQQLFHRSDLPAPRGMQSPGWSTPINLVKACDGLGLDYIAGARDVVTPVSRVAITGMSGPHGMPLIQPAFFPDSDVIHFATNFQATSSPDRAMRILEAGGLLSIKAHIVRQWRSYVALDGVTEVYCNYLDLLVDRINREFGNQVWFASIAEMADQYREALTLRGERL